MRNLKKYPIILPCSSSKEIYMRAAATIQFSQRDPYYDYGMSNNQKEVDESIKRALRKAFEGKNFESVTVEKDPNLYDSQAEDATIGVVVRVKGANKANGESNDGPNDLSSNLISSIKKEVKEELNNTKFVKNVIKSFGIKKIQWKGIAVKILRVTPKK